MAMSSLLLLFFVFLQLAVENAKDGDTGSSDGEEKERKQLC